MFGLLQVDVARHRTHTPRHRTHPTRRAIRRAVTAGVVVALSWAGSGPTGGQAAAAVPVVVSAATGAASGKAPIGTAPRVPTEFTEIGAKTGTEVLTVDVTLQPRDQAALSEFATQVSTPGSPIYRHHLTPAQFGQRFGATDQAVAEVLATLQKLGLSPGPVDVNHLSIPSPRRRPNWRRPSRPASKATGAPTGGSATRTPRQRRSRCPPQRRSKPSSGWTTCTKGSRC